MKFTHLKEMLEMVTLPGSELVLHHHEPDTAYERVQEWLEKLRYQVKQHVTHPADIVIAMDAGAEMPKGGMIFDMFEQNTDIGGGEVFSYSSTNGREGNGRWYRTEQWNGECPWEDTAYEFMPHLMPELVDVLTPDRCEMIYFGANTDYSDYRYPFRRLCDRILQAVQAGKIVFLCNTEETMRDCGFWKAWRAQRFLSDQLPDDALYYVTSGLDHPKDVVLGKLNILSTLRFDWISSNGSRKNDHEECQPYDTESVRDKTFLLFNRVPRLHRLELLERLVKKNLHSEGVISFDPEDLSLEEYPSLLQLKDSFPWAVNRTPERENPVFLNDDDMQYYESTYFSVVPETVYYDHSEGGGPGSSTFHSRFISEKPFKSIIAKHPFILVGQYQILQSLRDFGYRTFHPWIDESYDQIEDDQLRMRAIIKEIQRLHNQTPAQWAEWLQGVRDVVEFNHKYNGQERNLTLKTSAYQKLLNRVNNGS